MPLQILDTDKAFDFSPDAGGPDCLCSRCNKQITEEEAPILRFVGETDGKEYRYCDKCSSSMGFHKMPVMPWEDDPFDPIEVRKCRVCGCTDNDCRQCIEKTGFPCHWVEDDLCSACKK